MNLAERRFHRIADDRIGPGRECSIAPVELKNRDLTPLEGDAVELFRSTYGTRCPPEFTDRKFQQRIEIRCKHDIPSDRAFRQVVMQRIWVAIQIDEFQQLQLRIGMLLASIEYRFEPNVVCRVEIVRSAPAWVTV